MTEQIRENYFYIVRVLMLLVFEIYLMLENADAAGISGRVFLLLALFLGCVVWKGFVSGKKRYGMLLIAVGIWLVLVNNDSADYLLLGVVLIYEIISCFGSRSAIWYMIPMLFAFIPTSIPSGVSALICMFLGIIYYQQDMIIRAYSEKMREGTMEEERLKRNIHQQEHAWKEETRRKVLVLENQMLEERARLSQTLHDKLGHSINGSIYQLEAAKVLLESDKETSRAMVQAVIDNLRTGMDEIRAILRREKPKKYKLALLQLQQLCDECCQMGVEANLITEGEMEQIPEKYLEIVLDNAFEAVSNALKYAKCSRIDIKLHTMNKMLRCSVKDNGVGCSEVVDGMGISGMRKRMREVNGILDFETEMGFSVNMLLPLEKEGK